MKQIMILRMDLGMSAGKAAAQACHASLGAYLLSTPAEQKAWFLGGQTKIIVQVDDEEAMLELHKLLIADPKLKKRCALIKDAGHTELEGQNYTAIGCGPVDPKVIDPYTRKLKLYK
jgi:PTH2 family peptidyl-tRNA hydrolase